MLFDLRGRGRRRTVQIIYMGLALLMGVGLIGFGIGGGFGSGGLLSAASNNEGSGGATFSSEISKYRKLTKQQPSNAGAWEKLISAQLHEAGNEAYVTPTGAVTSKGRELFSQVAQSWSRYLALNPARPNAELAERMVTVFGEEGLNEPAAAVQVLQIVVAARPASASFYASLAQYAYKANNVREGDLAAEKAISLAPAAQRPRLKNELAALKKHPNGRESATGATSGTPSTSTTSTATSTTPAAPSPSKKK
jgi:hypothetical protein